MTDDRIPNVLEDGEDRKRTGQTVPDGEIVGNQDSEHRTNIDRLTETAAIHGTRIGSDGSGYQGDPEGSTALFLEDDDDDLNENFISLRRWQFALVIALFAFSTLWVGVNAYGLITQTALLPDLALSWTGRGFVVGVDSPDAAPDLRAGDAMLAIDGRAIENRFEYRSTVRTLDPARAHTMLISRDGTILAASFEPPPVTNDFRIASFIVGILSPLAFLITGLVVFLFKPDNLLTVLISITFALLAQSIPPLYVTAVTENFPWGMIWRFGDFIELFYPPILLNFFLLFPTRSKLLDRFPKLPILAFVPFILYVIPVEVAQSLSYAGLTVFDFTINSIVYGFVDQFFVLYLLFDLLILGGNYLNADRHGRRRVRVFLIGIIVAAGPAIVIDLVLVPLEMFSGISFFPSQAVQLILTSGPATLAPPIFAFSVVRHRLIPISFVIRRGAQYLLTTSALRVLIGFCLVMVAWNILNALDRTISDILLRNSFAFYAFATAGIALVLINRIGLRDWLDRRFFREQYHQERLLAELIDEVRTVDSIPKLSRLVSSKIHSALHPASVYLFFQEERNSEFSLGYSTNDRMSGLKMSADSPVLDFIRHHEGALELDTRNIKQLPVHEKRLLRTMNAALLVPMNGTDGRLAGIFVLGEKMSQIPYTAKDKEILGSLANQIAVVHENLNLKNRVHQEQKIRAEVLSRFDGNAFNILKECPKCGKCYDRIVERCIDDNFELSFSLPVERVIDGRYRLELLLGKGGMGAVYSAVDTRIDRKVAVKILTGGKFGDREALRRFEREAQATGKVSHRNIVTVFDYGLLATEGAYLVMELVDGETLSQVLCDRSRLGVTKIVSWFDQLLCGVAAAHRSGIIHRDLKPDNVFVAHADDGTDRLCIVDFGLAKLTDNEVAENVTIPGTVMGTLGYMSPEQLRGEKVDERGDIFAMGVMIYEALRGARPFGGSIYKDLINSMSKDIVIEPDDPFGEVFRRSLAIDVEERFASADEMRDVLLRSRPSL